MSKPDDVVEALGKGGAHWREGRSAFEAAHSWFVAGGLPASIRNLLKTDPAFREPVVLKAIFEKKTKLDSYGRESQTDVVAYVETRSGLAVVGVEAKVDETFGPLVHEWNNYTSGKLRRLAGLLDMLKLRSGLVSTLRYQLLHRTAATLIEAKEAGAHEAALVVQSFDKRRAGFFDFVAFADAFGVPIAEVGRLSQPKKVGDVAIRLGWTENHLHSAKRIADGTS